MAILATIRYLVDSSTPCLLDGYVDRITAVTANQIGGRVSITTWRLPTPFMPVTGIVLMRSGTPVVYVDRGEVKSDD